MHISSMKVFSQTFNLLIKLPEVFAIMQRSDQSNTSRRLHHTHMGTHPWVGYKHTFSQPPAAQPSSPIVEHVPDWLPASCFLVCKVQFTQTVCYASTGLNDAIFVFYTKAIGIDKSNDFKIRSQSELLLANYWY